MPTAVDPQPWEPVASLGGESRSELARSRWLAAGAVVGAVLTLLLPWYRSFFGVTTDGWFFFFAHQLLRGHVPYRDFYLFAPPWHVFEISLLIRLFGEHLLAAHVLGLLQRVGLALILLRWFAAIYSLEAAVVASVASVAVFSADIADTVFFYHQDAAFWGIGAAAAAALCLRLADHGRQRRAALAAAASGLLAGICFVDKQTIGLGLSVALPCALLLTIGRPARRIPWGLLGGWLAAWLVPVGSVLLWLWRQDAVRPFVEQVFLGGTASKGSLGTILTRPFADALRSESLRGAAGWALCLLFVIALVRPGRAYEPSALSSTRRYGAALAGLAAMVMILVGQRVAAVGREPRLIAIYVALLGSLGLAAALGGPLLLGRACSERDRQRFLLAGSAFVLSFMFALSWPAWEAMTLPGAGLILCEAWTRAEARSAFLRHAVTATALLLALACASSKAAAPFLWGEWFEPPLSAAVSSSHAELLRGFALSPSTASFVDGVADLIRAHSQPQDPIFVFPHLPALYLLSDRQPPTFGYVHWFDVAPDSLARRDAATLLRVRPAVLVNYEISKPEWRLNERMFRDGNPSGQRELLDAMRQLGASPDYELIADFPAPVTHSRVTIWARRATAGAPLLP